MVFSQLQPSKWFKYTKIGILLIIWVIFTLILMSTSEKEIHHRQIAITNDQNNGYILREHPYAARVGIHLKGAFIDETNTTINALRVYLELLHIKQAPNFTNIDENEITHIENITTDWVLMVADEDAFDTTSELTRKNVFTFSDAIVEKLLQNKAMVRVKIQKNFERSMSVFLTYDPAPMDTSIGVIYAAVVLLMLYIMIVWEVVHRTFAAMLSSTLAIAILAALHERPSMPELMSWIDVETLLLLFGMMILVAILSETGVFDYLAVYAYKVGATNQYLIFE